MRQETQLEKQKNYMVFFSILIMLSLPNLSSAFASDKEFRCASEDTRCVLGIFPHGDKHHMEATYSPIAADLSIVSNTPMRLETSSSLQNFGNRLKGGQYDIALVGSGEFYQMARDVGYLPIARRNQSLKFSIVVKEKSPLNTLTDLKGKRVGLMPPGTATHLVTGYMLNQAGLDLDNDINSHAFKSQPSCLHALNIDLTDACTVASPVLEVTSMNTGQQFKFLAISHAYPNAVYMIHKDVAPEAALEIRDYFESRPGMIPTTDNDYLPFTRIHHIMNLEKES